MDTEATNDPRKTVQSAVVIMPPEDIWGQIQEIRKVHDKSYKRWMPHINLLYPFVKNDMFTSVVDQVKAAVANVQPFTLTFNEFQYFTHGKNCTLWLRPDTEPTKMTHAVQTSLEGAFPFCDDLSKRDPAHGFQPHLSVGQFGKFEVENARKKFQSSWQPVHWTVKEVYIISRQGFDDPFHVNYRVPFGDEPVQEVAAVATKEKRSSKGRLFVGNLPFSVDEAKLGELFRARSLSPVAVTVAKAPGGRSKGFGFVEFDTEEAASQAIAALDNAQLDGRAINVKKANS